MIPGISGVLLNEGKIRGLKVLVPIVRKGNNISDARTAAHVIEMIDKLMHTIKIDLEHLYNEAENVEKHLTGRRKQAVKPTDDHYGMYR